MVPTQRRRSWPPSQLVILSECVCCAWPVRYRRRRTITLLSTPTILHCHNRWRWNRPLHLHTTNPGDSQFKQRLPFQLNLDPLASGNDEGTEYSRHTSKAKVSDGTVSLPFCFCFSSSRRRTWSSFRYPHTLNTLHTYIAITLLPS